MRRAPPGFLVQAPAAEGGIVLLDPGPGSLSRTAKAGIPLEAVDRVVLTHFHPDHTLDLMALLFARRNHALKKKLKNLTLIGPTGTREFHQRMQGLYGDWVSDRDGLFEIVEVREGVLPPENGLPGTAYGTAHLPGSVGYRFEFHAGSVAFSGDSDFCENLIHLGKEADLFFLECAVPDGPKPPQGHLSPITAARVAARANPTRLVLHHFYPQVDVPSALKTVQAACGSEVIAAEDGAIYTLGDTTDK
ncbi:MAG: ribonuclease Z [Planctomycetes bacterium]|nr:ribonuclease Z [Planctomycetota bacterium]